MICRCGKASGAVRSNYRDNTGKRDWLSYPSAQGEVRLPVADPYVEIYMLRDIAYRMVDPKWLAPGAKQKKMNPGEPDDAWSLYVEYLTKAKQFHDDLQDSFHPESYQFYGSDLDSPDRVVFTRKENSPLTKHSLAREHFVNKGGFHTFVDKSDAPLSDSEESAAIVTLELPSGKGDGTVPDSSGRFLKMGTERTTEIGAKDASWFEISHQDIYGTERAHKVVFTCIWNLVQTYMNDQMESEGRG